MDMPDKVYNATCPKTVKNPFQSGAVTFAQQNSVIMTGDGNVVWTGDRWQSACAATVKKQGLPATGIPVTQDCIKAYDLQYWSLLRWDEISTPPLPHQVHWEDQIKVNITPAELPRN
jgi:hypothetical protein